MSNPFKSNSETFTAGRRVIPEAEFLSSDVERTEWKSTGGYFRDYKSVAALIAPLDMPILAAIEVRGEYVVGNKDKMALVEKRAKESKKENKHYPLYASPVGPVTFRVRSGVAYGFLRGVVDSMPASLYEDMVRTSSKKLFAFGGTFASLGRIIAHYPRERKSSMAGIVIPLARELDLAFRNCGIPETLDGKVLSLDEVKINLSASNGMPVFGKGTDLEHLEKCYELARGMRLEAERHLAQRDTMEVFLNTVCSERPELMTAVGKAKADMYTCAKVEEFAMRFYLNFPRHLCLLMQQTTQVLEAGTINILDAEGHRFGRGVHTTQGAALQFGGAERLVKALQFQLTFGLGYAYVHCGDDTWIVLKHLGGLILIGLDCTSFDLTQRREVTAGIKSRLSKLLTAADPVSGGIWTHIMESRRVLLHGSMVRMMTHGGPSGGPLQSKVNDLAADVICQRFCTQALAMVNAGQVIKEEDFLDLAVRTGNSLGFKIKLESFIYIPGSPFNVVPLKDALLQCKFLYCGNYFYTDPDTYKVVYHADLPRSLAGLPYPGVVWVQDKAVLTLKETLRVSSIVYSWGMPSQDLVEFFAAATSACIKMIDAALASLPGGADYEDKDLRWLGDNVFAAVPDAPSLKGIRRVLLRDRMDQFREATSPLTSLALEADVPSLPSSSRKKGPPAFKLIIPLHPKIRVYRGEGVGRLNDGRPPPRRLWIPEEEWNEARGRPLVTMGSQVRNSSRTIDGQVYPGFEIEHDEDYGVAEEDQYWDDHDDEDIYDVYHTDEDWEGFGPVDWQEFERTDLGHQTRTREEVYGKGGLLDQMD